MHIYFFPFQFSGRTPLGQPIPGCNPQPGPQSSPSNAQLEEADSRSGSHCCCTKIGFCPNPRDYEGGFVSILCSCGNSTLFYIQKNYLKKNDNF